MRDVGGRSEPTEGDAFDPPTYAEPTGRGPGETATRSPRVFMRYGDDIIMELGNGPGGGAIFIVRLPGRIRE